MRNTRVLRRGAAMASALALAAGLSACTDAADWHASGSSTASTSTQGYDTSGIQKDDTIAAMLSSDDLSDGSLDIGASTDYAPAEFLSSSGKAIGYDVDLTTAIGKVLGVPSTTHTAEFDSIIAAMGSKYDLGVSSFTITTEREQSVDMISYINVGSSFDVQAGNPKGIDTSDHLKLCGLAVGVQVGTSQEDTMKQDAEKCSAAGEATLQVRSYNTQSEASTALAGGTIDAMYADSTVAGYAVEQTGGQLETVGEVEDALPQGILVSKDDPTLTKAVQAAVQKLMDDGTWQKILEAWGIEDGALDKAEINPNVEE